MDDSTGDDRTGRLLSTGLSSLLVLMLLGFQVFAHDPDPGKDNANIVELVRELGPSVVAVQVKVEDMQIFPGAEEGEQQGGGSGFVVDRQGRIVTNFHVIAGALREDAMERGILEMRPDASVAVTFIEDPEKKHPIRVVGANAEYDLALLELVDGADRPDVAPLPLGDSDRVEAGQEAIVIGAPFGLQSTVTSGIISAIERERPGLVGLEIPFIQSDAATNPGNSGGPLFNARGEVIGISNAILASPMGPRAFVGVGFAVPINLLKENMDELKAGGFSGLAAALTEIPERPRLGLTAPVSVEDYPAELRKAVELPEHGIVVGDVSPKGPAAEAGLMGATGAVFAGGQAFPVGGDVIIAVDGEDVQRTIQLQEVVLDHGAGDVVTLTVWRDGEERRVRVRLEVVPLEQESEPTSAEPQPSGSEQAQTWPTHTVGPAS